MTHLLFEWAIKFPDGTYYTGPVFQGRLHEKNLQFVQNDNPFTNRTKHPQAIFTYAKNRAEVLIIQHPDIFAGCVAEKVL